MGISQETVLLLATFALSVLSAVWSFFRVYAKRKAERSLEQVLRYKISDDMLAWLRQERLGGGDERAARAEMEAYQRLMSIIEQASKELDEEERAYITEGLYQPSLKGRQDYAWKIIQGLVQQGNTG